MRIYEVSDLIDSQRDVDDLIKIIQETIKPDSWFDAGGEGTIKIYQNRKLIVTQTSEIHQKIPKFLQSLKIGKPRAVIDIPVGDTVKRKQDLLLDKRNLEMEIAAGKARRKAIEEQVIKIAQEVEQKIQGDATTAQLNNLLMELQEQLKFLQANKKIANTPMLVQVTEKIANIELRITEHTIMLTERAGGNQLADLNNGLANIVVDLAENQAMLGIISKQLQDTEQRLRNAAVFDPQRSQLEAARETFEIAKNRLNELRLLEASLRLPTVTVLGIN